MICSLIEFFPGQRNSKKFWPSRWFLLNNHSEQGKVLVSKGMDLTLLNLLLLLQKLPEESVSLPETVTQNNTGLIAHVTPGAKAVPFLLHKGHGGPLSSFLALGEGTPQGYCCACHCWLHLGYLSHTLPLKNFHVSCLISRWNSNSFPLYKFQVVNRPKFLKGQAC